MSVLTGKQAIDYARRRGIASVTNMGEAIPLKDAEKLVEDGCRNVYLMLDSLFGEGASVYYDFSRAVLCGHRAVGAEETVFSELSQAIVKAGQETAMDDDAAPPEVEWTYARNSFSDELLGELEVINELAGRDLGFRLFRDVIQTKEVGR